RVGLLDDGGRSEGRARTQRSSAVDRRRLEAAAEVRAPRSRWLGAPLRRREAAPEGGLRGRHRGEQAYTGQLGLLDGPRVAVLLLVSAMEGGHRAVAKRLVEEPRRLRPGSLRDLDRERPVLPGVAKIEQVSAADLVGGKAAVGEGAPGAHEE